jgi:hypothetical protein
MLTLCVAVTSKPCTAPIESDILTLCVAVTSEPCTAPIESDILTLCVVVTSEPCTLADLLGVVSSSLFTSLLGVIVVEGLLEDPLLNLLPWLLTGDELD